MVNKKRITTVFVLLVIFIILFLIGVKTESKKRESISLNKCYSVLSQEFDSLNESLIKWETDGYPYNHVLCSELSGTLGRIIMVMEMETAYGWKDKVFESDLQSFLKIFYSFANQQVADLRYDSIKNIDSMLTEDEQQYLNQVSEIIDLICENLSSIGGQSNQNTITVNEFKNMFLISFETIDLTQNQKDEYAADTNNKLNDIDYVQIGTSDQIYVYADKEKWVQYHTEKILLATSSVSVPDNLYVTDLVENVTLIRTMTEDIIESIVKNRSLVELNDIESYNVNLLMFLLAEKNPEYGGGYLNAFHVDEVMFYPFNTQIEIDLDNDGMNEELYVETVHSPNNTSTILYYITINGIESEVYYESHSMMPEQFALVTLGEKQVIAISNELFNMSKLFWWEDGQILDHSLPGTLSPHYIGMDVDNTGEHPVITAYTKTDLLQSWYYQIRYIFDGQTFRELIPDKGYHPMHYPSFLIDNLVAYSDMNMYSPFVMKGGQPVYFTGIVENSGDGYVQITDQNGRSGFIKVNSYDVWQKKESTDLFYGMQFFE